MLEIIPKDDSIFLPSLPPTSIKSPPISTKSQTHKPVVVEGIPMSKSSPFMAENVISEDDASEVTTLHEESKAQGKEQAKINQAILHQFENLSKGTKIADKGQEMFTKMVLNQSAANFDPIPKLATNTAMGEWMDSNHSILAASPWDIDGRSMVDMEGVVLADASRHYKARSTKLGIIMRQLLKNAGLTDVIKSLKATIETNDGILLMNSIHEHLLPLATTCILEVLTEVGLCM